jgi:vancomycin resistance protein YoaR
MDVKLALRIVLAVLCIGSPAVPLGAWAVWRTSEPGVDPRVKLEGRVVGGNADRLEQWIAERTRDKLASSIVLVLPDGEEVSVELETLGFLPDTQATERALREASALLHACDPLGCWEAWRTLEEGGVDVPIRIDIEPGVLIEYLVEIKERTDTPPTEARIDFETGEITDHVDGTALEVYTCAAAIEKAVGAGGSRRVELTAAAIEPRLTAETLSSLDHDVVISSFSTTFPHKSRNASRAHNVAHAAARLDGTIILAGRTVSFNAVVGERSLEAGFETAPEIYEGEMIEGVGGGTCQVSSTFHAAAVYAGLEVVERYPHSRPSSYIRMGLDATVAYPTVDLRIRNPYPMPVVVRARTEKGRLTVEILGPTDPVEVKLSTRVVRKDPFEERIETDPTMAEGIVLVEQYGLPGYLLKRVRRLDYADGTSRTETDTDYYPPVTHLVTVNPATGYTGLTPAERGVEAQEADEGELEGEELEQRPADFAAPEAAAELPEPAEPAWTIVNGPFAHPPRSD